MPLGLLRLLFSRLYRIWGAIMMVFTFVALRVIGCCVPATRDLCCINPVIHPDFPNAQPVLEYPESNEQ